MTVKEILRQIEMNLLRGRDEKLSEDLIIDYAKQKVKERDEQWIAVLEEIGYYNIQRLIELLPEPEFE